MSLVPYVHLDVALADAQVGDRVPLGADAHHHLTRVLRLRDGAVIEVSDGHGSAAPARLDGEAVVLTAAVETRPAPRPRLIVLQGLPRSRKLDEVVRQVTELGADRIVPVAAARSVARLEGDKADRAVARWRAVARSAAEQSRRAWRPEVTDVTATSALPGVLPAGTRLLVAHVDAAVPLPAAVADAGAAPELAIAVGPEGGWTEDEVRVLVAAGASVVGLGPNVLRTEHAAAAALAVVAATAGRWD